MATQTALHLALLVMALGASLHPVSTVVGAKYWLGLRLDLPLPLVHQQLKNTAIHWSVPNK